MLALLCSFQGPWKGAGRTGRRSLKTQQHADVPEDAMTRLGRRARSRHGLEPRGMRRLDVPAAPVLELPRKEVIQPHLPVRLPCYDFTPVTSPTFDGSLPEGLGHRLRVLLASVV